MTFTPVVPFSGYAGWKFLNRTMEKQQAAFVASADIKRNEDYFREKIGGIKTAEELVADRRLLTVALGAFGLDEDINNKYFIKKVLEEGTLDSDALANKLADKRYLEFSKAFGFGDFSVANTALSDFPDEILAKYEERQFEIAVGDADQTMRMALNLQRELPVLAEKSTTESTKWYSIIGSEALSQTFLTALSLPSSVSALDVDQQVTIYQKKLDAMFGSSDPAIFADPAQLEKLTKAYLLRADLGTVNSISSSGTALQLLQSSGSARTLSLLL